MFNRPRRFRNSLALSSIAFAVPACAQLNLGGPINAGMGGAGLALPLDCANSGRLNPALFGKLKKSFRVNMPEAGYDSHGLNLSDLRDQFKSSNSAGVNSDDLASYARKFGSERKEFGVNAGLGVGLGGFDFSVTGQGDVTTVPNAALMTYVRNGSTVPTGAEQLDAYGYGYYSLNLSYGAPLTIQGGELNAGLRLKVVKSYYSHYYVSGASITSGYGSSATTAGEMGGAKNLSKNSVGVDAGFLFSPASEPKLNVGLVVENLIEPSSGFDYSSAGLLQPAAAGNSFNPFKRAFNVGASYQVAPGIYLAADAIDLGDHAGREAGRFGIDYEAGHGIGLRAGYDSSAKFTAGVSYAGFNVMLSGHNSASLAYVLKF